MKLKKETLTYVWLVLLTAGLAAVGLGRWNRSFGEISVERLNVIEADGKPRVIISNAARFPGIYWGGRQYRHIGRETGKASRGGFLFFNDDGDEVGGMLFNTGFENGKRYANSSLVLDQNHQDQIMGLQYSEYDGKRTAGLRVWDQPDQSLLPLIKLNDQAARATTQQERENLNSRMEEASQKYPRFGERFFAGKNEGDAIVKLSDKQGRPRLILRVSDAGQPSVEFLSAAGRVVKRIGP